ncbi:MAG: hypothetical protein PWP28_1542 [Oceanotoga sp.]|jgi:hypothetical protein|uniref:Uncharacterized protein n=1 Tax=Oceanotoga teriensis TaxID=515440 RepID=A0AA45HJ00_9BACT|nr:hypothetical protein [Oceanotoga sp.]PWJ95257.1 hypothetical protein C7380_10665 [Oceanotoga teriensis]
MNKYLEKILNKKQKKEIENIYKYIHYDNIRKF